MKIKKEKQTLNRYPINFLGNKYVEGRNLIYDPNINIDYSKYDIICEPFCGIYGFSRALYESKKLKNNCEIWLNDINPHLISFINKFKSRDKKLIETLKNVKEETKNLSDLETKKYINNLDNQEMIFILKHMGIMSCFGMINKNKLYTKINNFLDNDVHEKHKDMLENIKTFNMDYMEFMDILPKNKNILIYFDPPYIISSNTSYDIERKFEKFKYNDKTYTIPIDATNIYVDIINLFNKKKNKKHNYLLVINKVSIVHEFMKKHLLISYPKMYQSSSIKKGETSYSKNFTIHNVYFT